MTTHRQIPSFRARWGAILPALLFLTFCGGTTTDENALDRNEDSSPSTVPAEPTAPAPEGDDPQALPVAPSALCGRAGATSVTLNWHDNSDNEDGFVILNWETVFHSVGPDVTSVTIGGLPTGTIYLFRVVAYNSFGESSSSNVLTLKTTSGGCGG